jgi:lambda repressor-like predicted transcriptional regulator
LVLLMPDRVFAKANAVKTAIADVRDNEGCANTFDMTAWRDRLASAIEERGETMRSASLKAKLGANYVHGVLKDGKDPTVEKLLAVCEALGISPAYILLGDKAPPEVEALLLLMQTSPARRQAILDLLRT